MALMKSSSNSTPPKLTQGYNSHTQKPQKPETINYHATPLYKLKASDKEPYKSDLNISLLTNNIL